MVQAEEEKTTNQDVTSGVCATANAIIASGYKGEGLRTDTAWDFVFIAAADPLIEASMTDRDRALWWIIVTKYRAWLAKKALGLATTDEVVM